MIYKHDGSLGKFKYRDSKSGLPVYEVPMMHKSAIKQVVVEDVYITGHYKVSDALNVVVKGNLNIWLSGIQACLDSQTQADDI